MQLKFKTKIFLYLQHPAKVSHYTFDISGKAHFRRALHVNTLRNCLDIIVSPSAIITLAFGTGWKPPTRQE